jgi:signal transduction histidine kinase
MVLDQSAAQSARAQLAAAPLDAALPRLGDFLLQRGFITDDQLKQALARQQALLAQGQNMMLGEVLVSHGAIAQSDLDRAIVDQLVSLQTELRDSNRLLARRVAERTAELERAIERVQQINQLKIDFISNISHELRTPLTHIQGYVAMMNEGMLGEFNPRQRETIGATAQAVADLRQLIFDLVDYTSAARGEIAIQGAPFSLSALAESIVQRSSKKAAERRVALLYQAGGEAVWAAGDTEKISWVLLQLVDNALRFTPAGGSVRMVLGVVRNRARLAVQDTGAGIPPERLAELFQPLRGQGAGLGLVMAGRILEAHGSKLEVESAEGSGSTFWFDLPLEAGTPA